MIVHFPIFVYSPHFTNLIKVAYYGFKKKEVPMKKVALFS